LSVYLLVDLGFGDAGKGLLTDFLARRRGRGVVIRYNGGAQAGHNVVTPDGRHHTFSQFGAGTFVPGMRTYLSHHVVIHPTALLVEGDLLQQKGVRDAYSRLRISAGALVITPFHQAANRIREMARGEARHGSCGVGVGEAVEDALTAPETALRAADLLQPPALRQKLQAIREQKYRQIRPLCGAITHPLLAQELDIFIRDEVLENWMDAIERIRQLELVASDEILQEWLNESEDVIFEGAQGVLLDAEAGFHPHTTWSDCTTRNAEELLRAFLPGTTVYRIGILRCYAVRHGPGPLPTEDATLSPLIAEHNRFNPWQGPVRYGWFDPLLARYALQVTGGVDCLAVTYLDLLPRLEQWRYCGGYAPLPHSARSESATPERWLTAIPDQRSLSLVERAQLTEAMKKVQPRLESVPPNEAAVLDAIENLLELPVDFFSRGPCAAQVQMSRHFPSHLHQRSKD
jgi:adenylosuccinate synthase